jgi:hypothetical protein
VVEEIIGRLPKLTGAQLSRLEDELRRERQRRASSASGGQDTPLIQEDAVPPVTEILEYRPYEDGYLQLDYAATSVATTRLASVDPTGTSSSTRVASVGSSTSVRLATQRAPWAPSGQSPRGSRSLPWPGSAGKDEKPQLEALPRFS